MTRTTLGRVVAVALATIGLLHPTHAAAAEQVTVTISVALGEKWCSPHYPGCTTTVSGVGVGDAAHALWELQLTMFDNTRGCEDMWRWGHWELRASGGQDAIFGSVDQNGPGQPLLWIVEGGRGAYAGRVGASPAGSPQGFARVFPSVALPMPCSTIPLPNGGAIAGDSLDDHEVWAGDLQFALVPA